MQTMKSNGDMATISNDYSPMGYNMTGFWENRSI
jgi:hypothetical protein